MPTTSPTAAPTTTPALPVTGGSSTLGVIGAGLGLLVAGAVLLVVSLRRRA